MSSSTLKNQDGGYEGESGRFRIYCNILKKEDEDEWMVHKLKVTYWIRPRNDPQKGYAVEGTDGTRLYFRNFFEAISFCFQEYFIV